MKIVLPLKAIKLIDTFEKASFECYVVGGFIRDQFLKRKTEAIGLDFATNATPEDMLKLLPEAKYENKFGTVIVPQPNHDYFEITTYRSETGYKDRRHPDKVVWGKKLEDDLKRRDFTVNALSYNGKRFVDLFNGQADIKNKVIRTIGNPAERFGEDALRLMRAIRFASELGFSIDPQTLSAIKANSELLSRVSLERVRDEFLKILTSPNPKDGVLLLKDTGLLNIFLPELVEAFSVEQVSPERHHLYDVGTHLVESLKECHNRQAIVRLSCLLHDIGKIKTRQIRDGIVTFYNHEIVGTEMAYEIGKRLKLSKKDLTKLTKLIRYHQFTVSELQTDNAIRRFLNNVGKENIKDILDLRFADRVGSGAKLSSWRTDLFLKRLANVQKKPFSVSDLKINGHDVMKILKLKSGPKVGQILINLFDQVVKNKIKNSRPELLKELSKIKV